MATGQTCTACGQESQIGFAFCPRCCAAAEAVGAPSEKAPTSIFNPPALVFVIAVFGLGAYFASRERTSTPSPAPRTVAAAVAQIPAATAAPATAAPKPRATAALPPEAQRKKGREIIASAEKAGIIKKAGRPRPTAAIELWVRPGFYALDFEAKSGIAAAAVLAHIEASDLEFGALRSLRIFNAMTGKEIGKYGPKGMLDPRNGLTLY